MAITESRPFRTPSPQSVQTTLTLVSPTSDLTEFLDVWNPGDDLVLHATATLSEEFWEETTIPRDEEVQLVATASCIPARTRWRTQAPFVPADGVWRAEVELRVDGSELAVELLADLWVVGPGRTGSSNPRHAVHRNAKLWQLAVPASIPLEREESEFPTSATSFFASGRRATAWSIETTADAEPHRSISSSIRLYVNTDHEICHQIVDGTAPDDLYKAIESDIHLAVLHTLGKWRDAAPADRMEQIAADDPGSMAALGASIARSLGVSLDEGCRLAREDPIALLSRSREALESYRKSNLK